MPEAPSASALKTSVPRLTPPSKNTGTRPCAALTTWHHRYRDKIQSLFKTLIIFSINLAYVSGRNMLNYLFQRHNSGRDIIELASTVIRHNNPCCSSLNWKPCCKTSKKNKKCSSIHKNYKSDCQNCCYLYCSYHPQQWVHPSLELAVWWLSEATPRPIHIPKEINGATHLY